MEIKQQKLNKELKVLNVIANEVDSVVKNILPDNQKQFWYPSINRNSPHTLIMDGIYIINRFNDLHIPKQAFDIKYSNEFENTTLDQRSRENLEILEQRLKSGMGLEFVSDDGHIPNSSKKYLRKGIESNFNKRANLDFSSQFFGIKHFHINTEGNNDVLLYYIRDNFTLYFLRFGDHDEFYSYKNIEIMVREYPKLLKIINIYNYPDLPMINTGQNDKDNLDINQIKNAWINGVAIGFTIDGKYFQSINITATNNKSIMDMNEFNILVYQIRAQIDFFLENKEDIINRNQSFKLDFYTKIIRAKNYLQLLNI